MTLLAYRFALDPAPARTARPSIRFTTGAFRCEARHAVLPRVGRVKLHEPGTRLTGLVAAARKLDAKMALMAGSFSQRTTGRESPHVFSTDSRGRSVFASANRTPPDSAVPNAALSGSGETAGQ